MAWLCGLRVKEEAKMVRAGGIRQPLMRWLLIDPMNTLVHWTPVFIELVYCWAWLNYGGSPLEGKDANLREREGEVKNNRNKKVGGGWERWGLREFLIFNFYYHIIKGRHGILHKKWIIFKFWFLWRYFGFVILKWLLLYINPYRIIIITSWYKKGDV